MIIIIFEAVTNVIFINKITLRFKLKLNEDCFKVIKEIKKKKENDNELIHFETRNV